MNSRFVFKLSDSDQFLVEGAKEVNLNDAHEMYYTFWHPNVGIGKKQMYMTPSVFRDEALDLLYISLMVFYVDRKVQRSIQDDAWTRNIEIYIPVVAYNTWKVNSKILADALSFLTGDHWKLHFRQRVGLSASESGYRKARHYFRRSVKKMDTETFCMLSGGLDSFIGAINLLQSGKKPIFVGNYNGGKGVKKYQDKVVRSLAVKYGVSAERFYRFYAAPLSGKEDTTRSRSLLFFAHAIAIASGMGHHVDLYIPENGVISLNIPLTVMRSGSLSTRTTHPYFMSLLQKLITNLGLDIKLINPFQFQTKGEMMKNCQDKAFLNSHYQFTMSCSHPDQGRWSGEETGHCGECLPCTIRRAAIKAAGLQDATYYRHQYNTPQGVYALKSYKQGLAEKKYALSAIQMSGPITERKDEYAALYERGIKELKDIIDTF